MTPGDILKEEDFKHQMRFRKGEIGAFFAPGPEHDARVMQRRKWLLHDRDACLAIRPEGVELLRETLEIAGAHGTLTTSESRLRRDSDTPLELCRMLGEDWEADFLLMRPDASGVLRLVGGCLCFPSHWSLQDKMNQPMAAIHGPVPGLNQALGRQIDGFLMKIRPGISWERVNWGLARTPELNLHPSMHPPRLDASVNLDEVWWRLEEQSLVALPGSGGVLFGIKVSVMNLPDVVADPKARTGLVRALQTMPAPMAEYKGIASARERLLELLTDG